MLVVLSVLVEEGVLVVLRVNRGGQTRSGSTLVVGWVLVMVHILIMSQRWLYLWS